MSADACWTAWATLADSPVQVAGSLPWDAILRLAAAAALGAIIGAEREHHGRSAGFRTQLLVALGSALAMVVSLHFADVYGRAGQGSISVDPARIAYGVMGGIGFLGAGTIIRYGAGVRGLTTAASLWCTAAVGLACGFGMYLLAAVTTAIVVFALTVLSGLDRILLPVRYKSVTITLPAAGQANLARLRETLEGRGFRVIDATYRLNAAERTETLTFVVRLGSRKTLADLVALQADLPELKGFGVS